MIMRIPNEKCYQTIGRGIGISTPSVAHRGSRGAENAPKAFLFTFSPRSLVLARSLKDYSRLNDSRIQPSNKAATRLQRQGSQFFQLHTPFASYHIPAPSPARNRSTRTPSLVQAQATRIQHSTHHAVRQPFVTFTARVFVSSSSGIRRSGATPSTLPFALDQFVDPLER